MSALKEFANFITLNKANLATTYARLLAENGEPTDAQVASTRRLITAVAEACESGTPNQFYHLLNPQTDSSPATVEPLRLPQPLLEIECLGQTLTPVVTNLEAGKFLWQMLADARATILHGFEILTPPPAPRPADKRKPNPNQVEAKDHSLKEPLPLSPERLRQIINSISDHIYVTEVTQDGQLINLYLSSHVADLTGYPWQQFMDDWSFWPSLIHPDDREAASAQAARLAKGQNSSTEYRLSRASGDFIWVRDSGQVSPEADGKFTIYGVISDISEYKQAEERLTAERNLLNTFMDSLPDNMYIKDRQGRILIANQTSAQHLGTTVDELIGKTDFDFFPADLASQYFADEQLLLEKGQALINHEVQVFDQETGTEKWLWITKVPFRDSQGQVVGLVGLNRDITQLKQTEQAFRESQQLLQSLIDNSEAIIFVKDLQGRHLLVNKQFETLFHFDRENVIGKTDYDIFPLEVAEMLRGNDRKLIEGGVPVLAEESAIFDDGPRTYLSTKFPLFDSAGVIYAVGGISTNITDRKHIESEREQLLDETNRRVQREQTIREITEKMRAATSLEQLVKTTACELGQHLAAGHAVVELGMESQTRQIGPVPNLSSNGH